MRFRTAVLLNLGAQVIALASSVAFVLLVSRFLGPQQRGVHALALTVSQLGALAFSLGAPGAVASFLAADETRVPQLRRMLLWVGLGVTAGFCILGWLLALGVGLPEVRDLALAIGVTGVTSFVRDCALSTALARHRHVRAAAISVVAPLVAVVLLLALPRELLGAEQALFLQAAGFLLAGTFGLPAFSGGVVESKIRRPLANSWWAPSLLGYGSTLLSLAMLRADLLIVAHFSGTVAAGVYALAQSLAELVLKVPTWVAMVLTPRVASDPSSNVARTERLALVSLLAALSASVAAVLLRQPLSIVISLTAGEEYRRALPLFLLMLPRVVIQAGAAIIAAHLAGQGYTRWHPLHAAVGLGVVAVLCVAGASLAGPAGVALATGVGYLPAALLLLYGYRRENR